jgi:hypothetical protein
MTTPPLRQILRTPYRQDIQDQLGDKLRKQ